MALRKTIFGKTKASNLEISTQYASAVKLTFTPITMQNPVSYYKVYISGTYYADILESGDYVVDLTPSTTYTMSIAAVDTLGNESLQSNEYTTTTVSLPNYPGVSNMISYWKMDGNANDSVGTNNGITTDISFVPGVVNTAAHFDLASTSGIEVADNDSLSFTDGTNDKPFSITFFFKLDAGADISKNHTFIQKGFADVGKREYSIFYFGGNKIRFRLQTSSPTEFNNIQCETDFTPNPGQLYSIECTYDGSESASGQKIYISAVKNKNAFSELNVYSGVTNLQYPLFFGKLNLMNETPEYYELTLDGFIDQVVFWDLELNQGQISDIRYKQRVLNQYLI